VVLQGAETKKGVGNQEFKRKEIEEPCLSSIYIYILRLCILEYTVQIACFMQCNPDSSIKDVLV